MNEKRQPKNNIGCRRAVDGSDDRLWQEVARMLDADPHLTASDAMKTLAKRGAGLPEPPRVIQADESLLRRVIREEVNGGGMAGLRPAAPPESPSARPKTQGGAVRL